MDNNDLFAEMLHSSGDLAYRWNLETDSVEWFGAWAEFFREAKAPHNSRTLHDAIHADDRHKVFGPEQPDIDRKYRIIASGNALKWVHERGQVEYKDGHAAIQRGVLRIIPPPALYSEENSAHDPLTNTMTRASMMAKLSVLLSERGQGMPDFAYLVIGIDKMSFVNEAMGMTAGDGLLRAAADRLKNILPATSFIGRVGGDVFGALLPNPLGEDLSSLGRQLVDDFRLMPIVVAERPLHITISVGGVRLPSTSADSQHAMILAEQALHEARERGRNTFVEYEDLPERAAGNRQMLEIGGRIKHAFKNNGFKLAYQPIIEAGSLYPIFYEALVRMFNDDGSPIPAAHFIPAVEQLGLAYEMDKLVLDLAIEELELSPDLCLSINVSGHTAVHEEWPDYLRHILSARPNIAKRIIMEITETAAIVDVKKTLRFVAVLRELGGRVALDDFGAGFTSIRHLKVLNVAIMKIDRELLTNILERHDQQHLVRSLISLAQGLGLRTVAEGVETVEVSDWLRNAGADMLQGYYFGKPGFDHPWRTEKPTQKVSENDIILKKTNSESRSAHL